MDKNTDLEEIRQQYRDAGYEDSVIDEEIAAQYFGTVLADEGMRQKLAKQNAPLWKRVIEHLKTVLADITERIQKVFAGDKAVQAAYLQDVKTIQRHIKEFEGVLDKVIAEGKSGQERKFSEQSGQERTEEDRSKQNEQKTVFSRVITEANVRKSLEDAYNGDLNDRTYIPLRKNTPSLFVEVVKAHSGGKVNLKDLPMVSTVEHIRQIMEEDDGGRMKGGKRPHGLDEDDIINVVKAMDDPAYITYQQNGRYAEIVRIKNKQKKDVLVSIENGEEFKDEPYMNDYGAGCYNTVVTVYSPDDLDDYLSKNEVIYDKKKGIAPVGSGRIMTFAQLQSPFEDSIAQNEKESQESKQSRVLDSVGRELTEGQQAYFADSKIRDEKGHLLVMYHGTDAEFTVFDTSVSGGKNGRAEGYGIYLSDTQEVTKHYGERQIEAYVNIKRPAYADRKTITRKELSKLIKTMCEREAGRMVKEDEYDNVNDALRDTWVSNYVYTYGYSSMRDVYTAVTEQILRANDNDADIVYEVMNGSGINDYDSAMAFYDEVLTPTTGIDGIWQKWTEEKTGQYANIILAFRSEQIKNITNENPTGSKDIRYSRVLDQEYMAAVEAGDEAEQARLVEEAAKEAGYTIRAYHGTNQGDFTVFDWERTQRADAGLYGRGHYFSPDIAGAKVYGKRIVNAYLKITKPFVFEDEIYTYDGNAPENRNLLTSNVLFMINMSEKLASVFGKRKVSLYDNENYEFKDVYWSDLRGMINAVMPELQLLEYSDGHYEWKYDYGIFGSQTHEEYQTKEAAEQDKAFAAMILLFNGKYDVNNMPMDPTAYYLGGDVDAADAFSEAIQEQGYDGVLQAKNGDEIVVFDSSQIKSAEPITYDNKGNVIPLSERFNPEKDDIRFSRVIEQKQNEVINYLMNENEAQAQQIMELKAMYEDLRKAGRMRKGKEKLPKRNTLNDIIGRYIMNDPSDKTHRGEVTDRVIGMLNRLYDGDMSYNAFVAELHEVIRDEVENAGHYKRQERGTQTPLSLLWFSVSLYI